MNKKEITQADNLTCPQCQLSHIKKNAHTRYGKQNYQCLNCQPQFVIRDETVSLSEKEFIKSLLLERISLCGICRVLGILLGWLLSFIESLYLANPADLNFQFPADAEIELLRLEADELWSFMPKKKNKRWIWLSLERRTRQILAVQIGNRSQKSATAVWAKVPPAVKDRALVLTDRWEAYGLAIPTAQHPACKKQSGQV